MQWRSKTSAIGLEECFLRGEDGSVAARIGFLVVLIVVAALTGCSGGGGTSVSPPPQGPPDFFFVENLSQTIEGFDEQSGHLAVIPGSGTQIPLPPSSLAADPQGQFLGVVEIQDINARQLQLVAIQAGGTLQPGAHVSVPGAVALAFSGNRLLAVVDQNDEQVEVFSIQNGTPTLVSSAPAGPLPLDVLFSADGKKLYVANEFGDSISVYSVTANGTLQPVQTLQLPLAPGQIIAPVVRLRLNPSGDRLAATTGMGQLYVSQVSPTDGTLSGTQETIVANGANLEEVIFDPSGRNIYTGDQDNGGLYEFAVAADGSTAPLAGSPVPAMPLLTGMVMNSAGDRLYVVNGANSEIVTYLRDTTSGKLTATAEVVSSGGFLPGRIVRVPAH
jgi:6-phosphogluconolactonase (cycloisomerase 2 family)